MRKFRSTFLFALVVAAVVTFAFWESKRSAQEVEEKNRAGQILPGFSTEGLRHFRVEGVQSYNLEYKEARWVLVHPVQDLADSVDFTDYVRDLATQQVESLDLEDAKINWTQYGLEHPEATFELEFADGHKDRIAVGSVRTLDKGYYLRRNNEETIYVGSASWQNIVARTYADWENKKVIMPHEAPMALQLEANGAQQFQLESKEGYWLNTKDPEMKIDQVAVAEFVAAIRDVRAAKVFADSESQAEIKKFIEKKSIKKAAVTIKMNFKDGQNVTLDLSPLTSGGVLLAASTMKAQFQLTDTDFVKLNRSLKDLRDTNYPFRFDFSSAQSLVISRLAADKGRRFNKKENSWSDAADPAKKVNQAQVEGAIRQVHELKVQSFEAPSRWPEKGVEALSILSGENKELLKLEFYSKGKDADYLARTNLSKEIFRLAKSEVDAIIDQEYYETDKKP